MLELHEESAAVLRAFTAWQESSGRALVGYFLAGTVPSLRFTDQERAWEFGPGEMARLLGNAQRGEEIDWDGLALVEGAMEEES